MSYSYKFEYKRNVIDAVFELLESCSLTKEQAKRFIEVVKGTYKTDLQKERFIKIYNLEFEYEGKPKYSTIAKEYNCSSSAIRSSVIGVHGALYRSTDENIDIVKEILKEHQKENTT